MNIVDHLILGIALSPAGGGNRPAISEIVPQSMLAWDPLCRQLLSGKLDGAFINLPLAMDLAGSGAGLTLVMFSHRGGSQLTGKRERAKRSDFSGKSLLIPHDLSIQHMLMHKFFADQGLTLAAASPAGSSMVCAEAVPLNLMQEMLANDSDGDIAAMIAPAPVSSKGPDGCAPILNSQKLWKNHPCCIVAMQKDFIQDHPEAVQEFVSLLVETGEFIENDKNRAAQIAVNFLDPEGKMGLNPQVLQNVFSQPMAIRWDGLYPEASDLDKIQRYMHDVMDIGKIIDLEAFIDTSFANNAYNI